ncbi:MAG: hypothetical protein M3083_17110 [Actinomycetota bacterium]|nr:hypothetical protein [Actinomycetota bacterium]MDQ6947454.1 hypothetical protein [Actinomycetota bacterium]
MTAAIFSLIGVLVGGLVPAFSQYLNARRDQRTVVQANRRLASLDLERASKALDRRLEPRAWLTAQPWADELVTDGWAGRLEILAKGMSDNQWSAAAEACVMVEKLKQGIAAKWNEDIARDKRALKELSDANDRIKAALDRLSPQSGGRSRQS